MKNLAHSAFFHVILQSALALGFNLMGGIQVAAQESTPTQADTSSSASSVTAVLTGPRSMAFNTATESCELIDIPDAPARAFRDDQGMIHLVSSHYVMRQNIGPTFGTLKHSCAIAYNSKHDPNPADWDDSTWLDSFYSIDGKQIVALGHMEYHGWEHPGECHTTNNNACWYNGDTFHVSNDGGYHFGSFKAPKNYVLSLPYKYQVDRGPEGYSIDTNIVKVGPWYYAMVTDWPWPPNCGQTGNPPCKVQFGGAPIRTDNILDPTSWRGWGGSDFTVTFADPYPGPVSHPEQHVYTPVPWMYYVNGINYNETNQTFVATLFDPWNTAYGPPGMYLSTSPDLVNWTTPKLVVTVADLLKKEPKGNWSYGYFSLIDPNSNDASFSTIGDEAYLYYVRFDNNHPPYVRVLFRQKVQLTWK